LAVAPHPAGSRILQGAEDLSRIGVGDHEVIYRVEDENLVVLVVIVGRRRHIYRDL
jgi:mRNA interferase RelE/StbE